MPIPKVIYQTFKTADLPLITRWHIRRFRKKNSEYAYEFYDDLRIEQFFAEEFDNEMLDLYRKLNIGAAKADFFRYAILLKKGGVYLDIDSAVNGKLSSLIRPDDSALVSPESNGICYIQWALIYESGHPFLKKTMEIILENIRWNKFPHDVHHMTGPTPYTLAIKECLKNNPEIPHRFLTPEYGNHMKFKYRLSNFFLYGNKSQHWKKLQITSTVLKP
jgi:mannosyltransferase OCH1-like enzyme